MSHAQPAWISEMTYIRTRSSWLYLTAIQDLHSRKIVDWAMASEMLAVLVCHPLQMVIVQRNHHRVSSCIQIEARSMQNSAHHVLLTEHGLGRQI